MPKRKRSSSEELEEKLEEYKQELFRALKTAKGFERQRLSKRIHSDRGDQDKLHRLEREVVVLKTLDLQETARAHLSSSLLKFKTIAEHPALPESIKHGAPNTKISEEDKVSLHNVTSGLCNRQNVREVVDKAVRGVCMTLEVPIPEKKSRGKRKQEKDQGQDAKTLETQETISEQGHGSENRPGELSGASKRRRLENDEDNEDGAGEVSDEFNGFSDGVAEDESDGEEDNSDDQEQADEDAEEAAIAKYETLLGSSDDESEDVEDLRAKYGALLDAHGDDEQSDSEDEEDDDELNLDAEGVAGMKEEDEISGSDSEDFDGRTPAKGALARGTKSQASSAPERGSSPSAPRKTKASKATTTGSTTFLPTLMGGYFSGSESASDVDVAPRKKRLGQRQRQAIAERKHGERANHIQRQAQQQQKKGGRDSGWDVKRGAVDPNDMGRGKGRQPWKKNGEGGGSRVDSRSSQRRDHTDGHRRERPKKPVDEGPVHPSWQARQKQKEAEKTASFQGTKIKF